MKLNLPGIWYKTKGYTKFLLPLLFFLMTYCFFFNHVEPNKVGLARNHFTGDTWVQKAGWHVSAPWVWVANVDINPIRVGVPTAGHGFSAKLIRFVPEHFNEFLEQEGWHYYWWDNRLSFNLGNPEEYRGLRNIFLGHAYSKKTPPFIEILEEYQ